MRTKICSDFFKLVELIVCTYHPNEYRPSVQFYRPSVYYNVINQFSQGCCVHQLVIHSSNLVGPVYTMTYVIASNLKLRPRFIILNDKRKDLHNVFFLKRNSVNFRSCAIYHRITWIRYALTHISVRPASKIPSSQGKMLPGFLPESGPVFCILLSVSSDCAQPITGQVTLVTWPVIGCAQSELTPSKRQKMGPGHHFKISSGQSW